MATIEATPRVTLGDLLKRARLDAGFDQAELAIKIGASRASVGAWERDRNEPDFTWVREIIRVTGAQWLLTEPYRKRDRAIRCYVDLAGQERAEARELVAA